jgi:myo-inositol-1(or 4)-monophosphatase
VDLSRELDVAVAAVAEAGDALLARFTGQTVATRSKERRQEVVTDADLAAERILLERIRGAFPDDGVLSEESGAAGARSPRRWYVDPLDGTANFAAGVPHWAIALALVDGDRPLLAVTHDPVRGETFTALAGEGARLGGEPLSVADTDAIEDALIADNLPYRSRNGGLRARMERSRGLRETGSMALDLAWVARGRFHAAAHGRTARPWDYVGGELLVRCAGGEVATLSGDPALALAGPPALVAALAGRPMLVRTEGPWP